MRHSFFALSALFVASALPAAEPIKTKINLFDVIKSGDVEYHLNQKMELHDDPRDIWKFEGDEFHISGRGYGYVATKKDYRDYHLVIEFKWGTKTHGARETKARDNGILLHAYGPHGAYSGTWMASIEAQIIEGGVGDILVLSPKLEDGKELTTSVVSEFSLDRDKEKIWTPGAPKQLVTKGRINWQHRDVDWTDTRGFRGREDKESPPGEWNRLECIADGDHLTYFLNGAKVNEAFECKPSQGRVLLQTEGAEMIVRRYELWPIGQFNEKWNPIQASGGSDVDVREGQTKALSAAESQKLIQLDGPYEAQLVASEPLVLDPVELTWDAKGRLYVADMLDYPLGSPNPGDPPMSRIVQLIDEDGDGRMDKSVVFAEHMDFVQGLLPYKEGLIATTRSQVLFLKDSDGDGKADVIESLIKGFNPRHAQLQVSAPRWGLDGCVHFNNGLDAKEIYGVAAGDGRSKMVDGVSPAKPSGPSSISPLPSSIDVSRSNFKWDPRTGKITPTGGTGQYGGAFDDWGHHFYCSNRNPVMFTVMPYEAMTRNPHAGITENWENIAPAGAETRVYPLKITHTTADAHAGTNTAACGLGVYRGDLMPELKNNVFVCDPTGQLITRYKVEPNGASLKATRVGKNTEFFRSSDEWCRPVNVTTGPDGALYICDMYRHWIDHARFFPEEFVKTHDMREGEHEGRIWRIVPKGKNARKIEPAPEKVEDVVAWLGHENAWQRETAQRMLVERKRDADVPLIEKATKTTENQFTRFYALHTLAGLKRLRASDLSAFVQSDPSYSTPEEGKESMLQYYAKLGDEAAVKNVISYVKTAQSRGVFWRHRLPALAAAVFDLGDQDDDLWFLTQIMLNGTAADTQALQMALSGARNRAGRLAFRVVNALKRDESQIHVEQDGRVFMEGSLIAEPQDSKLSKLREIAPSLQKRLSESDVRSHLGVWGQRILITVHPQVTHQRVIDVLNALTAVGADKYYWYCDDRTGLPIDSIRRIAATAAADSDENDLSVMLSAFHLANGQMLWWKPALLQGLAEGLPRSGGKLGVKSLAELIAKPPAQFAEAAKEISALMAQIETTAKDPQAPLDTRLSVLPLLAQQKWDKVQPIVKDLLTTTQPAELTTAALALVRKFSIKQTEPFIYEILPHSSPSLKGQLVTVLAAGSPLELLKRMDRGELPKALIDVEKRWGLQRGKGELAELAKKLFGQPSADRAAVITSYMDCTKKLGDAAKGKAVFQTICVACHKIGDIGQDVGPPLADIKVKPVEGLLSDILDPNRMFEARWCAYEIDTKDGKQLMGLVTGETTEAVTLTMMGGLKEIVQRSNIKEMKSLDRSLMPVGVEAGISKEQMSDLLAFLLGR